MRIEPPLEVVKQLALKMSSRRTVKIKFVLWAHRAEADQAIADPSW